MKVAFTLMFFGMLRQSNIAPATATSFDPSRHTARGDIIPSPPGLVVIAKWTKTIQTMDNVPVLPVPKVPGNPADPVAAYRALLKDCPSRHPNQPLLGYLHQGSRVVVTIAMLSAALRELLIALGLDCTLYSLHSFRRGAATTSYRAGVDVHDIKRHGTWSSDAFWDYVTAPIVAQSPVAAALANSMARPT
jgi:integrase